MITDEINSQDDYLGISLLDIIESWKYGFDQVNKFYGTNIEVEVNPILAERLTAAVDVSDDKPLEDTGVTSEEPENETQEQVITETPSEPTEEPLEQVQELAEEVIDAAADTKEGESDE